MSQEGAQILGGWARQVGETLFAPKTTFDLPHPYVSKNLGQTYLGGLHTPTLQLLLEQTLLWGKEEG